jgi:hypothetical protein
MGDADTTYDFEELPALMKELQTTSADMVMGSRLEGEIKPGAMPALHKYVGNPMLTAFLNFFYDAGVSDAHSGFRVFTRDALDVMAVETDGMEFASEMIMETAARDLDIGEVPITYHEREGEATLESFRDGWRHVRFMLVNAPGYLFSVPGFAMIVSGLVLMLLAYLNVRLGPMWLGIHTTVAGSLMTIAGIQVASFGVFARIAGNPIQQQKDPITESIVENVKLEYGASLGLALVAVGGAYSLFVLVRWVSSGFTVLPFLKADIIAMTLIVVGIQIVFSSFFMSILADS